MTEAGNGDRRIVDVWDVQTYDGELLAMLDGQRQLLIDYFRAEKEIDAEYAAPGYSLRRDNPFADAFLRFVEHISAAMRSRTIRAWHYSRMTDDEIALVRGSGLVPSTIEGLRLRLDRRVAAGDFTQAQANAIFAGSPFHAQPAARVGKIFMTARPEPHDYNGLQGILGHWGGESAYFWQEDPDILDLLSTTGTSAVIEIAMPVSASKHFANAGTAVVHRFARSLGCDCEAKDFELYSVQPLSPSAMLNIHLDGDALFRLIARGYPDRYVAEDA